MCVNDSVSNNVHLNKSLTLMIFSSEIQWDRIIFLRNVIMEDSTCLNGTCRFIDLLRWILLNRMHLGLSFYEDSPRFCGVGMILYNGQRRTTGADFISLGLVGGRLEFRSVFSDLSSTD